jgi:hypothetical protein
VKHMEEYPTPSQARGLLSGTNIRVPIRQELKDIDLSPSKTIASIAAASPTATKRVSSSLDPSGAGPTSPDPPGEDSASPNLLGEDSASPDPWGSDLLR